MSIEKITSFGKCVSSEERKKRFGTTLVNLIIWAVISLFMIGLVVCVVMMLLEGRKDVNGILIGVGAFFFAILIGWISKYLFAEYNVRKLQALGATVSADQFPVVHSAVEEIRRRFNVKRHVRVIVVASGEVNAFAVRFAKKHVVLLNSELLEGLIENRQQLLALLGHEMCHVVMDHGPRGTFEIIKSAPYRAAREMTCDNAGYVASGSVEETKAMLKKLCCGKVLHAYLSEPALIEESQQLNSGFVGWLLRQYMTHPPFGKRLQSVGQFAKKHGSPVTEPKIV